MITTDRMSADPRFEYRFFPLWAKVTTAAHKYHLFPSSVGLSECGNYDLSTPPEVVELPPPDVTQEEYCMACIEQGNWQAA